MAAVAALPGTIVVMMGISTLPATTQALIEGGRSAHEPAAVIERGTLAEQRTVTATLASIAERVQHDNLRNPAVLVVGPVVTALPGERG